MRVLFVTQNLPYPINSGSRLRTANLLKLLMLDHEVKCVFLPFRNMNIEEFRSACPASLDYTIVKPLDRHMIRRGYEYFTAPFFRRPEVLESLERQVESFKPDVAWLDYLFIGHYIGWFAEQGIPIIYGTHNAQSNLTKQQAIVEKTFVKKMQLSLMAVLHHFHERMFFRKAGRVVCVSKQDLEFHSRFVQRDLLVVVPNFVDVEAYAAVPPHVSGRPYVCFVGSIDNFQNAQGIKYFISRIWDKVTNTADVQLMIIGRGAKRDKELQTLVARYDNIQVIEDVDSVVPFIKGSLVSVVPLLQGSGTRLKIVESMACKSAVVSTSRGAEGIDAVNGKDILISDDANEFAGMVIRVVTDQECRRSLGKNAYEFSVRNFGFDSVHSTVQQLLAGKNFR
jgi:glycosyltransferase involved in cell wall biosynthesis